MSQITEVSFRKTPRSDGDENGQPADPAVRVPGTGHDHGDHDHCHGHDHDQAHTRVTPPGPGAQDMDSPASSDCAREACCGCASDSVSAPRDSLAQSDGQRTSIRILQMDCPTEEALIRKKLGGVAAVRALDFNLMQRVLTVVHTPGAQDAVLDAIRSLGFTPEVAQPHSEPQVVPKAAKPWWPLAGAGVAAAMSEAAHWFGQPEWITACLAILAVLACGLTTYKKGWVAIRNRNLNINALMSIAVTGALVLRQWPEAAMVMVLFTIAELIEAKSLDRARNAIQGLMRLAPEKATVKQADDSWTEVDVRNVELGAVVRVKPGERIGLDGIVVAGQSSVNQAPITGESLPVDKADGDPVFAGTINEAGSLEYRVTAAASNTTLARIIHAVEEAQGAKAPTQRFVDKFARIYTPIVFGIAVAVAVIPPLVGWGTWHEWVYKALVLLVIACPCALVISTPVSIVSGLAAAARHGILIKGGTYLEQARKIAWLALDKTGTITHGKPVQTDFQVIGNVDTARIRTLAASLAARSDHPVSLAIAAAASKDISHMQVDNFEAVPGRGVRGTIDGQSYALGNHRLVEELDRCSPELEARLDTLEQQGNTVVMLVADHGVLALFAVADTVKDSSRDAVADLHRLGVRTVMLTGDNAHTARAIAGKVGIDRTEGNQLPEDKLRVIEGLSGQGAMVGMVGDGINDAPALARADIGFAMGAMGTDTAIETADVALMDDDLRKIPRFIRLSKATHAILVQNITLALGIKAVFLALTIAGLGTMWMAVFADVGASLLVVGNGLRLLRK